MSTQLMIQIILLAKKEKLPIDKSEKDKRLKSLKTKGER